MHRSRSVAGLVERLSHCTYGEAYREGLKPAQWSALRYFSNANRFSNTTSAFARYQGITLGAASQTISALVQKRLLKRARDKADKRQYNLALTAKAEKLTVTDPIRSLVDAAFELGESERVATRDALEKMLVHLLREKGGAYFGYCNDCRFLQCVQGKGRPPDTFRCANLEQDLTCEDLKKICINFDPNVPLK
jgi:DNA-binding MarR family transcriptional regulator